MDNVKYDLDVTMSYANPGYHVPEIDLNNIKVKERHHVKYHRLPIQNIPKVMIRFFAFEVVILLNYYPVKGGLSP